MVFFLVFGIIFKNGLILNNGFLYIFFSFLCCKKFRIYFDIAIQMLINVYTFLFYPLFFKDIYKSCLSSSRYPLAYRYKHGHRHVPWYNLLTIILSHISFKKNDEIASFEKYIIRNFLKTAAVYLFSEITMRSWCIFYR